MMRFDLATEAATGAAAVTLVLGVQRVYRECKSRIREHFRSELEREQEQERMKLTLNTVPEHTAQLERLSGLVVASTKSMETGFTEVNKRLESLDGKIESLDGVVVEHSKTDETRFDRIDGRCERIEKVVNGGLKANPAH